MRYPGQDDVEVEVGTGTGGIIREEKKRAAWNGTGDAGLEVDGKYHN